MRPDQEMARLIRSKMEYSAHGRLRDHMWQDILAIHQQLQAKPSPVSLWRAIVKSRPLRVAAAAVLLAGILGLACYLVGLGKTQPIEPSPTTAALQDGHPIDATPTERMLVKERETARQLFVRRDLAGLMVLLRTGQDPTKTQVAEYLGQIGDSSVLPDLQSFATPWQGPALENPFLRAMEAIRERQDPSASQKTGTSEDANSVVAPTTEAPGPQVSPQTNQTGLAGVVLDKLTQRPIEGAIVQYILEDPNTATLTNAAGRFALTELRPSTHCFLYIMARGYASQRITLQMVKGQVTQDLFIEMDRGSRVQGTVTDPQGRPIAGATVDTSLS